MSELRRPMQRVQRTPAAPTAGPAAWRHGARRRGPPPWPPAATTAGDARRLPLDLFRLCLLGLLLMSLSRIHVHLGLGKFRVALALTVVAGAVAVFNPRLLNTGKLLQYWPAKVVLALGALACVSAPFGLSLGASAVFILEEYSKVLILFFLLVAAVRDERDLRFLMWGHVLSCAFLAYMALFVFKPRPSGGMMRLSHLYSFDANDIGAILVSGLPLAVLLFQTSRSRGRLLAGWSLFGIGASAAVSGSRGTFLGLLAVGGAMLIMVRGVSPLKKIGFLFAVAISLIAFAPPGYWEQMRTLKSPKEDYNWTSYYGRKQTAERAIGYMLERPFFGVGIANFGRAEGTISDRAETFVDRTGFANRWRASHNSFLQAGSELGIPGIVLWSSLILGSIIGLHRLRKKIGRAVPARGDPAQFLKLAALYLPVSFVGFAATAFFLSFAWVDLIYILAAFTTGVYICADRRLRMHPAARSLGARPRWGARRRETIVRPHPDQRRLPSAR